jgi:hypothetical protein
LQSDELVMLESLIALYERGVVVESTIGATDAVPPIHPALVTEVSQAHLMEASAC